MKVIEVHGQIWQKVSVDPYRFVEALVDDFLGHYRNYVREENGSYSIFSEDCHDFETKVRTITQEEYEYFEALKVVKNFLSKQRSAEIIKEREFETFKKNENS